MKYVSIRELSELTNSDRETVKKRLVGLDCKDGKNRAKLFRSDVALRKVMGMQGATDGEAISSVEAQRQLTIARKMQIDLEMEVTRKDRIPLDALEMVNDEVFSNVAGMLKTRLDKVLDKQTLDDLLKEMRSIGGRQRG